jgi:hypothetical protein
MFQLHGLTVASERDLHLSRRDETGAAPDLVLRWGDVRASSWQLPPGDPVLHLESVRPFYSASRLPGGDILFRVYGVCDFAIAADLRTVVVHPDPGVPEGLVAALAAGALPALVLGLAGHLVLHASAVESDGAAVAFVGPTGAGKSTLTASLCAHGARLISDDVLRVDLSSEPVARLGSGELWLPDSARTMLGVHGDVLQHGGGDRAAIRPGEAPPDRTPLRALVIPWPSPGHTSVEVRRLAGAEALMTAMRFPRLLGWRDSVVSAQLELTSSLLRAVPIVEARLPWGPISAGDARQLLSAVAVPVA